MTTSGDTASVTALTTKTTTTEIEYRTRRSEEFPHGFRVWYYTMTQRKKPLHMDAWFRTPEDLMVASCKFDLAFLQAGHIINHRIKVI